MEQGEVPRKKKREQMSAKLVGVLLSPLLVVFFRGEPGFLVSLVTLLQILILRIVALQGRKKFYVLEDRYLWILPLSGFLVFLIRGVAWYYFVGIAMVYLSCLLVPRKYRLPLYVLLQSMVFQALVPQDRKSLYTHVFLPSVYGIMMMIGGLGLLERRKK